MAENFYRLPNVPEQRANDLTVDNLCAALRFFFGQIVEHPELPVDPNLGLVLCGVPGDDTMKVLMERYGGEFKITVRELPTAMVPAFQEAVQGQELNLWKPELGREG